MGRHFPVREKSGNFVKFKNRWKILENGGKYWKREYCQSGKVGTLKEWIHLCKQTDTDYSGTVLDFQDGHFGGFICLGNIFVYKFFHFFSGSRCFSHTSRRIVCIVSVVGLYVYMSPCLQFACYLTHVKR